MSKKGLSVIESIIVVMIVGIFSAIALVRFEIVTRAAKYRTCNSNVSQMNALWETYYINSKLGNYPSLSELFNNRDYFPDGAPACPYNTPYEDADNDHRIDYHNH